MDENKLRFGVGVLVIAAIGIGVILTFLFGAFPALLNQEYTLTVYFPSAEGVNTNTPVLRDGVKIGRVADIQLRDEGGVVLTLAMDQKHQMNHRYLPQIGIGSLITGDSKLEFRKAEAKELKLLFEADEDIVELPYSDGEHFAYGQKLEDPFSLLFGMEDELRSTFRSIRGAGDAVQDIGQSIQTLVQDVRDVIGLESPSSSPRQSPQPGPVMGLPPQSHLTPAPDWASPVMLAAFQNSVPDNRFAPQGAAPTGTVDGPTIRDLTAEAIVTLEEFQGAVRDARAILGDQEMRANLSRSIEKVPGVIDEAAETLKTTRETFESFQDVSRQFEEVGEVATAAVTELKDSAGDTLESFRNTAKNVEAFTKPLGERGDELVIAVLRSLANVDNALMQLDTFGQSLNNSDGTVRRLLEDDELYYQIRRTVENVEAATARIRPILDDVRVFTDKIARDPRQLGVRGAISQRPSGAGIKAR